MNGHHKHDGMTMIEGFVLSLLTTLAIAWAVPERTFGLVFVPTVFFTMLLGTFTGPLRGGLGGALLFTFAAILRAVLQ